VNTLVYIVAWSVVRLLQALPLPWVARLGRVGGSLAYVLDARHRRVALKNLSLCFGKEMSPERIPGFARENFRRIGESYCCAVKTAAMSWEELAPHVEFFGPERMIEPTTANPRSVVIAIGHFGNFELYARFGNRNPNYRCATTYRALRPEGLDRILQELRGKSGCSYFERRTDMAALKAWVAPEGQILGFLSDQHAGRSGVRAPFFGMDCATTAAPAVFALRYNQPLHVAICFRVALAKWRIEISEPIQVEENGRPRFVEDITAEINRHFEAAVRRDPANWFWVHNRWKPDKLPAPRRQLLDPTATTGMG